MRGGFVIQDRTCPRCAIRRRVRLGDGAIFCFNCGLQAPAHCGGDGHAGHGLAWPVSEPLEPAVQAKLTIYRAAVRAGFYSDWPSAIPAFSPAHIARRGPTASAKPAVSHPAHQHLCKEPPEVTSFK